MTTAERLRAAAEKIRETAAGAVPVLPAFNRWGVTSDPLGVHVENGDGKGRIAMMVGGDRLDGRGHDTAHHIALWSPAAFADLILGAQAGGDVQTRAGQRPNLYQVMVVCPGDCAGAPHHKRVSTPLTLSTPDEFITPDGDDRGGVTIPSGEPLTPASAEPVREPIPESAASSSSVTTDRARERHVTDQADTALPNRDGETDIRPWRPEDGDRRCQRCGHPNVVWFTDADSWNTAMGNESGILCVRCFVGAYEAIYGATIWSLLPERPGLLSEFSRGMEAGRAATVAGAARALVEQRAAIESDVSARVAAAREEAAAKIEALLSATSGHERGEVPEWGPQVYCKKCGESWPCEVAEARDALAADIRKGADRG